MNLKIITINKDAILIAYKLLHDFLALLLFTFAATLVAEGLLPGLISSKISFSKMTISIFLVLALIAYLGKNLNITYSRIKKSKNKYMPMIVFLSFLLIGNSLLKFSLWENILITLITLFIFSQLYDLLFSEKV
jgi:uncharacterized membrane protein